MCEGPRGGEWGEVRIGRGPGRACKALWAMGRAQAFTLRKVGAMEGSRQRGCALIDRPGQFPGKDRRKWPSRNG